MKTLSLITWTFTEYKNSDSNVTGLTTAITMPSTRANPQRKINWLFFSEKNPKSTVHHLPVPAYPLDVTLEDLEWIAVIQKWFKFRADPSSLEFSQVNLQLILFLHRV